MLKNKGQLTNQILCYLSSDSKYILIILRELPNVLGVTEVLLGF